MLAVATVTHEDFGFNAEERQELVLRHYSLVRAIACRVHSRLPKAVDLDDLISTGVTGLIEAIDRYDHGRSVPFETYAKHRIHGAIVDALRAQDWVPRSVRRKADLLDATRLRLAQDLGHNPNADQMAGALHLSTVKYEAVVADAEIRPLLSLDAPMGDDNPTPLIEQVASSDDPNRAWAAAELKQVVLDALQRLPERERTAIALYYLQEWSLKEVGNALGVTESRACQLCTQGLKRLRQRVKGYAAA